MLTDVEVNHSEVTVKNLLTLTDPGAAQGHFIRPRRC